MEIVPPPKPKPKLGKQAEKIRQWMKEGKDTDGNELKPGDIVLLSSGSTKGKVLGFGKDGRLRVETFQEVTNGAGRRKQKFVYLLPSVQVRKEVEKETN